MLEQYQAPLTYIRKDFCIFEMIMLLILTIHKASLILYSTTYIKEFRRKLANFYNIRVLKF